MAPSIFLSPTGHAQRASRVAWVGLLLVSCLAGSGCSSLGPPQRDTWRDQPVASGTDPSALGRRIDALVEGKADARRPGDAPSDAGPSETRPAAPGSRATGPNIVAARPSGIHPLPGGREAFAVRLRLIESAVQTLDLQYYMWRDDVSGRMLLEAVRRAADRGVRVRLLLDDNNTSGQDALLAWLDEHPAIEVRLFNPFVQRRWRALDYLGDFDRLHRRMHNKSLTADNRATIIGGRNIGDTYFDATDDAAFADLDVLAVGPIVRAVAGDFARYWDSRSSYPVRQLAAPLDDATRQRLNQQLGEADDRVDAAYYREALERTRALADLREGRLELDWAPITLVSDEPSKVMDRGQPSPLSVVDMLARKTGRPQRSLDIVSPYFVPLTEGVDWLAGLVREGVRVRVLTNSLASTDVVAVHAGYARWREPLLDAGVELYEYRRDASRPDAGPTAAGGSGAAAAGRGRQSGGSGGSLSTGSSVTGSSGSGSSESSLHAKTFSVDGMRLYVGSANVDPRSAALNTEMGFLIESRRLTAAVDAAYARDMPRNAWRVDRDADGALRWTRQTADGTETRRTEPDATLGRRMRSSLLSILPLDWLL